MPQLYLTEAEATEKELRSQVFVFLRFFFQSLTIIAFPHLSQKFLFGTLVIILESLEVVRAGVAEVHL